MLVRYADYHEISLKHAYNFILPHHSFVMYLVQGIVKPDIVFFGEDLPRRFYSYMKDMLQTDLVIVMGTSLEVSQLSYIYTTNFFLQ